MNTNVIISICVSIALVGGTLYLISDEQGAPVRNVAVRDGVQYVTVTAQGGYFPRVSDIQSGIPTKLIVKTNGTYDCSASLVIRDVGYQSILPSTGEEVIDLGVPTSGQHIQGVCGMGMYNFLLNAK
jgi:plastocyanin domain-containing protein